MTALEKQIFDRTSLLLGDDVLSCLSSTRVIIFGIGGVGSWCAEGLVRTGISRLTIVDSDRVSLSNVNRQLMATTLTEGRPKVEALKERLLSINPDAQIRAIDSPYTVENADSFDLSVYDYIIDAIDSLRNKKELIVRAAAQEGATLLSSMGAALKIDPARVKIGEFSKVRDCPLGALVRKQLRRERRYPARKFLCVYGDELLENRGHPQGETELGGWDGAKARINGTTAPVTAIFGMTLAGLVIKDVYHKITEKHTENEG